MADETSFDDKPAPSKGKGVGGVFQKKIGPLPAWGWGIIAVGAIVLYMRYRAAKAAASPSAATATGQPLSNPAIAPTISPGQAGYAGSASDPLTALASQLAEFQGIQSQLGGLGVGPAATTAPVSGPAPPPMSSIGPNGLVIPSGNLAQDYLTQLQTSIGRTSPSLLSTWEAQGQQPGANELMALNAINQSAEAQAYQAGQWTRAYAPPPPVSGAAAPNVAPAPIMPNIPLAH
jgi:hypothetical protein